MRIDGVIHDTHRSATQLLDDAAPADAVHLVLVIARRHARRPQSAGAITCGECQFRNATGSPALWEG